MAGWELSVTTQTSQEREKHLDRDAILAKWTTGAMGIGPFEDLVETGHASLLRDDGYPRIYATEARHLLPIVRSVVEQAGGGALGNAWYVTARLSEIQACPPEQMLTVVAWDQS